MNISPESDANLEVDVVVLGTGAAGMTAALAAAAGGAEVAVFEKSDKIGGTTAVSGGIAWIPAHNKAPDLGVDDALAYLRAQSFGAMDEELVGTFVRGGQPMIDFVEAHSDMRFQIATGFPDYKPELPGGRPGGGRSLGPAPYDLDRVPGWGDRITAFPADFSNVGLDAETRARLHADYGDDSGDLVIAGSAMIAGLLRGLLDLGVEPLGGRSVALAQVRRQHRAHVAVARRVAKADKRLRVSPALLGGAPLHEGGGKGVEEFVVIDMSVAARTGEGGFEILVPCHLVAQLVLLLLPQHRGGLDDMKRESTARPPAESLAHRMHE